MPALVIAAPHPRYDRLERNLGRRFVTHEVVRIREKEELTTETLDRVKPDFVFFPHWSWLIPRDIHSRFECVVFHMTDLPYGRGGSPLQNLIVRGHRDTLISAIRCVEAVDEGPVYLKRPLSLAGRAEEILDRASDVMEAMIAEIVETRPTPIPQQGDAVRFERRRPEDGNLASVTDLDQAFDWIRMLDAEGYPRAFLDTPHLRLEFSEVRRGDDVIEARVCFRAKQ
jgi:methionyl-tRNA formyltransferase